MPMVMDRNAPSMGADNMTISTTGWIFRFMGLIFFVAGALILVLLYSNRQDLDFSFQMLSHYLIMTVSFLVGIGLILRRSGVIVCRETGRIVDWWGIIIPWVKKNYPIEASDELVMRHEEFSFSSDSQSMMVYRIRLMGKDAKKNVVLVESIRKENALLLSEPVARYLGKNIKTP
jgi:hypothetical protein